MMPDAKELLDQAFLEMRWRCLSLGADLDRLDRGHLADSDPRLVQLREAIGVLLKNVPNRAEQIQMIFSDQTPAPQTIARQTSPGALGKK